MSRIPNWVSAKHYHENEAFRCPKPHSVMVFPILFGNLVWVLHPVRGWEIPGGKLERGEAPEAAVRREAFEEAGLVLGKLVWLAEYQIETPEGPAAKWVYMSHVQDIGARPKSSEIMDVCMFHPVLTPTDVAHRENISPVMVDEVYQRVWPRISAQLETEG